jgi:4-alpha-glucanotransferase
VHALGWANETTISPYSPTHRGFLNAMHIRLEGAGDAGAPPVTGEFLDYAAHAGRQRPGLQAGFAAFEARADPEEHAAFAAFQSAGGTDLRKFAAFEALSTHHGADARIWPSDLQDPEAASRAADPDEIRFHLWMQWRAERQLGAAQETARAEGARLGLYLDLAVGARLGGAEHWANADARAEGVSIGAPPDALSPAGQNWGLCAYAPRKLQATRYAALRQILRQNMRHCGLLRIDHALGLNRSFWLPSDGTPGGYISQPFDALLAVVCIEAWRNGTVIVGEDLGLVPEGFRARIADAGLYGYTVLQFERDDAGRFRAPDHLRPHTLACFGTHDTPTLRGFWEGRDIDWWRRLDWIAEDDAPQARARRADEKRDLIGAVEEDAVENISFDEVRHRIHRHLATAPTALAAVQLDDMLGLPEAQNLPGTIDEHPNWRRAYPFDLADLAGEHSLQETARMMRNAGRGQPRPEDERTDHDR